MDTDAAYEMLKAFKVSEAVESLDEQVKQLESNLDLKDYYDIKRPTVVFFTQG